MPASRSRLRACNDAFQKAPTRLQLGHDGVVYGPAQEFSGQLPRFDFRI
jgi:hypothetical protein